jgi:hypothetical protein
MKVHKITCPECASSLTSKAGIEEGTPINCPKCKSKFAVAAAEADEEIIEDFEVIDEDDEDEAPKKPASKPALKPLSKQRRSDDDDDSDDDEPKKKPAAKPALKPLSKQRRPVAEDDEEEDERPSKPAAKSELKPLSRRKSDDDDDDDDDERPSKASRAFADRDDDDRPARKKRAVDDDEEDSPRSKRKGRAVDDDEDDEDRPRSKRRGRDDDDEPKSGFAKLKSNIYVRASVLGVLLVVMGVLGYLLIDKYRKKDDGSAKSDGDDPSKPIIQDTRKPGGTSPKAKSSGPVIPKGGVRHQGPSRVYNAAQGFSIETPSGWQNGPALGGAFIVMRPGKAISPVSLNVIMQPHKGTIEQVGAELKSGLPKLFPNAQIMEDGPTMIDGKEAYFVVYTMGQPPKGKANVEIKLMQYYIVNGNKQRAFILTFTDLASDFDTNRATFDKAVQSVMVD